ncbi:MULTISPECIES: hypothetical protein [Pseudomonas]|uniref:hypothetical protein n=1 Tax=Pseudomonas TaxID=286 RepID=UPI000F01B105|nr:MULTISPECIES: hypothetical protein [Pseudomonas]MBD8615168.1 hypothetical protein [Pseudomonas putida]MBD8681157.1 hypothetical protein [Pseudomonas sp. CFBP 13719]
MNTSKLSDSLNFVVKDSVINWPSLHQELAEQGIVSVRSTLASLPQRLHDIKAIRVLSPGGAKINLMIDQEAIDDGRLADLGPFLRNRHYAGMTLDADIGITILGSQVALDRLSEDFPKAR